MSSGRREARRNVRTSAHRSWVVSSTRDHTPADILTVITPVASVEGMTRGRRVTVNLPAHLLEEAMEATGKGITETLVEGLQLVRRARAYEKAMALRGRVKLSADLDGSRERRRR